MAYLERYSPMQRPLSRPKLNHQPPPGYARSIGRDRPSARASKIMSRRPNPITGKTKALDRIHPQIATLWWALTKAERESWNNANYLGSLNRLLGFYWKNLIQWQEKSGFYAAWPPVREWDLITATGQITKNEGNTAKATISLSHPTKMLAVALIRGQTEWHGLTIPSYKSIFACRGQATIELPISGIVKGTSHFWARAYGANGQISPDEFLGTIHIR